MKWKAFWWFWVIMVVLGYAISLATQQNNWLWVGICVGWFPAAIISDNGFRTYIKLLWS